MTNRATALLAAIVASAAIASAQPTDGGKIRVFIGPTEMAPGISAPVNPKEADSYRDLEKAFAVNARLAKIAEIVTERGAADVVFSVDKRGESAWTGKSLYVKLALAKSGLWQTTGDPLLVQHFARHADLETTRRYIVTRIDAQAAAAIAAYVARRATSQLPTAPSDLPTKTATLIDISSHPPTDRRARLKILLWKS